jgi:shikimate kinase
MKIITIDREFGAGGHTVGRAVARQLGIEFYDRDIITEAAVASGVDPEVIDRDDESVSRTESFIRAINPMLYDDKDTIFSYESRAIVKLASQGPCVVLGRCGNAILEDAGFDVFPVFLHANEESRVEAAGKILGITDRATILRQMRKKDVARRAYAACYSDRVWGDPHRYALTLDTGILGAQTCADVICQAVRDVQGR